MTATTAADKPAARTRRKPAAQAPATGAEVLHVSPAIAALDAAQAHAEWIVAVEDAYRTQVFEVAHDLLAVVRMDVDDAMDDIDEDLAAHVAAEDAYLRFHRAAHDRYVALVCATPVDALPAPFARVVERCPPHVLELEASPMGRLTAALDDDDDAKHWPEVTA